MKGHLSAVNCTNLLPGAGVGRCSDQSMRCMLKSPMITHLCCVRRISSSDALNASSSAAAIAVFRYPRTYLMCVVFFGFMSTCISSIVLVAIYFLSIGLSELLTYMIDPPPLLDGVGLSTEKIL